MCKVSLAHNIMTEGNRSQGMSRHERREPRCAFEKFADSEVLQCSACLLPLLPWCCKALTAV